MIPKSLYRLSVSTLSIVTISSVSSVASLSSGCNVLYNFNKFCLSWKMSKNTLFFCSTLYLYFLCLFYIVRHLITSISKTLWQKIQYELSFCISIIQKSVYLYNKIRIKFLPPLNSASLFITLVVLVLKFSPPFVSCENHIKFKLRHFYFLALVIALASTLKIFVIALRQIQQSPY